MKNKILVLFLTIIIGFGLPCSAFWGNKKLARINPKEKIEYVNINWWDNFSDPCIKYYIIKAIENNHETKEASWKVEEYKHFVKLQFSQELPSLSIGANYIGNHLPDNVKGINSNIFAIPLIANYEADVFLKNHDKTKSSKKDYEASRFQEHSIYLSLASSVATTYINTIKFDKQIQLQKNLVDIKKEELKREEARYKRGVVSAQAVNEYKKAYESAKNALNEFVKSRDKSLNQLAVLIGESPENAKNLERNSWDKLEYKNSIPKEISSDVIFSRPDILAAEAKLQKANIDVKVARKEFLPRINITGLYAFSNIGGNFGAWNGSVAAILAGLSQDLFTGGRKIANLKISKTRYEQMFEAYQQTDLNALKEVNDSLLILREDSNTYKNTNTNLLVQKDNYQRAAKSFQRGTISYTSLLEAQEQLLNVKLNQIDAKTTKLVDFITLYKAVGGKL